MEQGTMISINISGAVAHSAVFTQFVHGTVVTVTEKAVMVRFDDGASVWLPKKALVSKGEYYQLARWFKPIRYVWSVLDRNSRVSGVSAE